WPRQTVDKPASDRIAGWRHDNRYGRRGLFSRQRCQRSGGYDNVDVQLDQFKSQRGQPIEGIFPKSGNEDEGFPFYPTQSSEPFDKNGEGWGEKSGAEQTNAIDLARLLRTRHKRPRGY